MQTHKAISLKSKMDVQVGKMKFQGSALNLKFGVQNLKIRGKGGWSIFGVNFTENHRMSNLGNGYFM